MRLNAASEMSDRPAVPEARRLRSRTTCRETLRMTAEHSADLQPIRLVLFCGGRGSSTIVQELVRWRHVQTTLLVNGFDDGLSTGELRRFIPGMLGPSDFRKNLSVLAGLPPAETLAMRRILEYRLPIGATRDAAQVLAGRGGDENRLSPRDLPRLFRQLNPGLRGALQDYLMRFFEYEDTRPENGILGDCPIGNLIVAGAYLGHNHDFNASVQTLAKLCNARANLVNVGRGEARVLVALKESGELLGCEAAIVAPQSRFPILGLFLLPGPVSPQQSAELASLPLAEKRQRLQSWEKRVRVSPEAACALRNADLIVYGPGTQFSSLFPSYRLQGLTDCIREGSAVARVFIANLESDHDIQALTVENLIDKALEAMDDPYNHSRLITHVLYNGPSLSNPKGLKWASRPTPAVYRRAWIIEADFENHGTPAVHSGYRVVQNLFEFHAGPAGVWQSGRNRGMEAPG